MKTEKLPAKRVYVLVAIMAVWGLGIAARLYFLQVVASAGYVERARDQQTLPIKITPRRGDILFSDGNQLAISVKVDSVFAQPFAMEHREETAKALSRLTGVKYDWLIKQFDPKKTFVWVKRKISPREKAAIEKAKLPGVGFRKEFRRYYPGGDMAAHLLGYVDVDEQGMTGLEKTYNKSIQGQAGRIVMLRDAHGKTYEREEQVPQVGANIVTTIDKNVQFVVEKELKEALERTRAEAISIVVMEPQSGAILGLANGPAYNPNNYRASDQSTWINHAVSLTYEPGSTLKMATIAAALEANLTTPDEMIDCQRGLITLFGRTIKDHEPYGVLSVREIIQHSSNVGTIKIVQRLGNERLDTYLRGLGFGKRTGVDLPAEVGGLFRPTKAWSATSFASIAIGQEISVTPLQIASLLSTIANGGILYTPHVVQKILNPGSEPFEIEPKGHRVMSEVTAQQLHEMLEGVVTDGTARFSKLEGYRAAGKTGTAQKALEGKKGYAASKYVASFAGYAPASNPKFVIVVVVDEPKGKYYGAEVAAPVFKKIAEQILGAKAIAPDIPNYAPQYSAGPGKKKAKSKALPLPAPDFQEFKVLDAALTHSAATSNEFQVGDVVVPDFSRLSLRDAALEAGKAGLGTESAGSGRVVAQFPLPGSRVSPGARVRLKLK